VRVTVQQPQPSFTVCGQAQGSGSAGGTELAATL
jgi:hypothetical protein